MQAENETNEHNRTINLTEIPSEYLQELQIMVNYTGQSDVTKAVVLDNLIIPAIIRGLNTLTNEEIAVFAKRESIRYGTGYGITLDLKD
jgi:hypothetical protein